jgi:glycosyltransferase involved in cell wall biosynthesis
LDIEHDTFFGFSMASLEAMLREKRQAVWCVLDQIDPGRTEYLVVQEEEKRFKELVISEDAIPDKYFARLQSEWDISDRVLVNSEWSRGALITQGVPPHKIAMSPLPYRGPAVASAPRSYSGLLRVLWLGTLNLRKGLPYAVEAARQLQRAPVTFTFAGPSEVNLSRLSLPNNCEYIGQVPRSQALRVYGQHDVFLFPTLSDGFGLTQVEAMAHGLPVLATDRCGSVVEDERSGLMVRPGDALSIVRALERFLDCPRLLEEYSAAALRRAQDFTPERLWPVYSAAFAPRPSQRAGAKQGQGSEFRLAEGLAPMPAANSESL